MSFYKVLSRLCVVVIND